MGRIDEVLERVYQRLGWRIIVAYQAFSWAAAAALGAALTLWFGRVIRLSLADTLELVAVGWAGALVLMVVSTLGVLHSARPLIEWLDDARDPTDADAAWQAAMRLPQATVCWNPVAMLSLSPVAVFLAGEVASLDAGEVAWIAMGYICAAITMAVGCLFTAELASRPIVRDIRGSLVDRPSPGGGMPMRLKLLLGLPPLLPNVAAAGVAGGLRPGADLGAAVPEMLLAMAGATAFAVPITLILASTILQPLGDLTRATQRLKQGDYDTPVPELSGDETGLLARSLNDAMQGLGERQRLADENVELLEQVRASRARIVAASDAERRRVERNIHDGAQQQLVALAVKLRILEERVAGDHELRFAIAQIAERLSGALDELRELARGLHPSVLTTDGLQPALEQLVSRVPVPVELHAPDERFPEAIESTAYFIACEALANIGKYAQASRAEVSVEQRDGRLVVKIADDGVGGANVGTGSGLSGLVDRVAALDGQLIVNSPDGHGTTVIAELPLP